MGSMVIYTAWCEDHNIYVNQWAYHFDKGVIKRPVRKIYVEEKHIPKKVLEKLKGLINFIVDNSSLKIIRQEIGFRWAKTKNICTVLTETYKPEVWEYIIQKHKNI